MDWFEANFGKMTDAEMKEIKAEFSVVMRQGLLESPLQQRLNAMTDEEYSKYLDDMGMGKGKEN